MRGVLFLISTICTIAVSRATYYPNTKYVDVSCGQQVFVSQDVRIKLALHSTLQPNTLCLITLIPSNPGNILIARFRHYYMDPNYVTSGQCFVESVMLGSATTQFFGRYGYCGSSRPSGQFNLGSSGTFGFNAWQYSQIRAATVELLVTAVSKKLPLNTCPVGYFDCKYKNYCVDEELTCNGYDDCGNNRDEIQGCGISPGIIGGIAIVLGLIFRRHRRARAGHVQQF